MRLQALDVTGFAGAIIQQTLILKIKPTEGANGFDVRNRWIRVPRIVVG
jgi:hypothetical protein